MGVPTERPSTGSTASGALGASLATFTKKLARGDGVSVFPSLACARQ